MRGLGRRTARAGLTLLLVACAAWGCLRAAGDPLVAEARARGLLPAAGELDTVPAAVRARILAELAARPDEPRSLVAFLGRAVRGDLGHSWRDGEAVTARLARALPVTGALILGALAFAYALGLLAALLAASRPGGQRDRAVNLAAALALVVSPAWAAILCLRLAPGGWIASYGLPVAILGYVAVAVIARHGRAALVGLGHEMFVVAARARGASLARVLVVHQGAVAAPSWIALAGMLVPYLLGASIVVERVFDLHGLGALLLDAGGVGDAPVIIGGMLCAALIVSLSAILADLLAQLADPRLRGGS